MARITDYPAETTPENSDVMLLDGKKGTRTIAYENLKNDIVSDVPVPDPEIDIEKYPEETTPVNEDLLFLDGAKGPRKITYENLKNNIPTGGGGSTITVDSAMSSTSENPVQNKVVKEYIDGKSADISTDTNNAIEKKADGLFVDDKTSDIQAINDRLVNVKKYQRYVNTELDYCHCRLKNPYTPVVNEIVPFAKITGNLEVTNGKIKIKPKETVQIIIVLSYGDNENKVNIMYNLKDITNNKIVCQIQPTMAYTNAEYAFSTTCIYTNETENDCELALITYYIDLIDNINQYYSGITVTEIGRAITIDPVEYVNSEKGIEDAPVGHIISYMGKTAPKHYLSCDGTIYNIADYPYLSEHIKTEFGSYNYFGGDGTTTFAVPDLRGEFLRGTGTATRDSGSGSEVGEHQDGTQQLDVCYNGYNTCMQMNLPKPLHDNAQEILFKDKIFSGRAAWVQAVTKTGSTTNTVGGYFTSRPTNTSVLYCIKYEPTYYMNVPLNGLFCTKDFTGTIPALNPQAYGPFRVNVSVDDYTPIAVLSINYDDRHLALNRWNLQSNFIEVTFVNHDTAPTTNKPIAITVLYAKKMLFNT